MTEPFYVSRATLEKVKGAHRRAKLETGDSIELGVHGPPKEHYRLEGEADHPLPVDYIVAATGASLLGTLDAALAARGISLDPGALKAEVRGVNELRDEVPFLTSIEVQYTLSIPPGSRPIVERALENHARLCPAAASLEGTVELSWTAKVQEEDATEET